jgi:hypothetical protein
MDSLQQRQQRQQSSVVGSASLNHPQVRLTARLAAELAAECDGLAQMLPASGGELRPAVDSQPYSSLGSFVRFPEPPPFPWLRAAHRRVCSPKPHTIARTRAASLRKRRRALSQHQQGCWTSTISSTRSTTSLRPARGNSSPPPAGLRALVGDRRRVVHARSLLLRVWNRLRAKRPSSRRRW